MALKISTKVKAKLQQKHNVKEDEIYECFATCEKSFLIDTREDHQTDPPTHWFISETDYGRDLKVVFILNEDGDIEIKTAYEPNETEIYIYSKFAK